MDEVISAISASIRYASSTYPRFSRSPKKVASTVMIAAWTTSTEASRSDRPSSIASRLTGVTRDRSIIPARSSAIRPKPWNRPPNSASSTSSPGTKTRYASALLSTPSGASAGHSSGANSSRYITGWKIPTSTQTGLRSCSNACRW